MLLRALIVSLLCVAACKGGRLGANRGRDELARVNDEVVFVDEVKRELLASRLPGRGDEDRGEEVGGSARRALESLIDKKLLLQEAARHHLVVPTDLVEKHYSRLKDEFPANELDKMLEERRLTPATFKDLTRDQLLIAKLFREEVYARVVITDADLQDYWKAHPELSHQEEKVRCSQIVARSQDEMVRVLEQVQKGMPFEEAASRFSMAPEGKNGGDLGWFGRGVMPPVIEEGCFGGEINKISKPLTADYEDDEDAEKMLKMTHVFKVTAKKPAEDVPLERVRGDVDMRLRREREEKAEAEFLATLRRKATVSVDDKRLSALGS